MKLGRPALFRDRRKKGASGGQLEGVVGGKRGGGLILGEDEVSAGVSGVGKDYLTGETKETIADDGTLEIGGHACGVERLGEEDEEVAVVGSGDVDVGEVGGGDADGVVVENETGIADETGKSGDLGALEPTEEAEISGLEQGKATERGKRLKARGEGQEGVVGVCDLAESGGEEFHGVSLKKREGASNRVAIGSGETLENDAGWGGAGEDEVGRVGVAKSGKDIQEVSAQGG